MHLFAALSIGVPFTAALTLQKQTPNCTAFAKQLSLDAYNTTLLNATYYPAKSLNVSDTYNNVSFCEVYTSTSYGSNKNNSLIAATWLPDRSQYDDRFMAVGNGGMAGTIDHSGMMTQLNSGLGFAVAGGNAGHLASENNDGGGESGVYLPYLHDEDQVRAWIHDAISLFTPAAKALTAEYYESNATYSFYHGCSTGGAQGMSLAQYHPELFDGIIAGCPGNWYSHLALSFLWNAQHTNTNTSKLSQAKLNLTTNAVLDACDLNDGVADRVLENPLSCTFNIATLACNSTNADSSQCLTSSELRAAQEIYTGPRNANTSEPLYPGFSLGSEISWSLQQGELSESFSVPILQNLVYDNLSYDASAFDWSSDVANLDTRAGARIDAVDPDLSAFKSAGGKLLIYQGWADPYNAATWPIEHLAQIRAGPAGEKGKLDDWLKLFMVPGGGHCGAAEFYPQVPAKYHSVARMVQWVEGGEAPGEVLSSDAPDGSARTRKLCAWPGEARFVGDDVDDWASFVCE